jgi:hypothetical protein
MKILHITPSSNGYEEVILLANRMNRKNHMAVIEKDGQQFFTGGYLISDTPEIRKVLDAIPKEEQYKFVHTFKQDPFVRPYFEEPYGDEIKPFYEKDYWYYEGYLFYVVGYNSKITGHSKNVAYFWKWSENSEKKAIRLARLLNKKRV